LANLLVGCQLRAQMDQLFPDLSQFVQKHQVKQSQQHDTAITLHSYNDLVYVKNLSSPTITWIPGKVVKTIGLFSYHVELLSGHIFRCHVYAVRK